MAERVGGTIQLKVNGEIQNAKGAFKYGLGTPKRETVMGADRPHGIKETPQVGFIDGAITDRAGLDVKAVFNGRNVTATLELANGKTVSLTNGDYCGDAEGDTDEGELPVRWEGDVEEIPS